MENIKYQIECRSRQDIASTILQKMDEGWTLLYAIPLAQFTLTQFNFTNTPNVANNYLDQTGQLHMPSQQTTEPQIELYFIKKLWEQAPCPRCSYPYTDEDRIDREI